MAEPVNLLLVDDRPDGLLAMEAVLKGPEYNLVKASSAQEALSYLFQYDFAVILLDIQMPVMNGFEMAKIVKQNESWKHIPIIFLTAINKEIANIYQGYECGAVDYLFKPFDPWILKCKVSIFVELYVKTKQISQQTQMLLEINQALQTEMAERIRMQKEILEVRDEEQKRIGQDLHDGLAQQLAGISFMSQILHQQLQNAARPEVEQAQEVLDAIKKAIFETKRLARGFYPLELERHGLFPALEELAINTAKQFQVECTCEFDSSVQIDDPELATHLFRITQESVNNAVKHGRAKRLAISCLKKPSGQIAFSIEDNGAGIRDEHDQNGMGFSTMNYRAKMIGATLSITKGTECGVCVSLTFDIPSHRDRRPYRISEEKMALNTRGQKW